MEKIKIQCQRCGAERYIRPQHRKQVKLCITCQYVKSAEYHADYQKKRNARVKKK